VRGPRRTRKALDLPPQAFDFLVVLDFEWTCDNRRRLEPSEIIEFPSVLVRCSFPPQIIDEFQVFCRPQVNPRLSSFCTELTGIGQETVDKGVRLGEALSQHSEWLRKHGLLARDDGQENGARPSTFAIVTWSDADVAMQLNSELSAKNLPRPSHFDRWINLKLLYKQHYKRAPTGGLVSLLPSQTPFSPVKLPSPQSNSLLPSQTPFSPVNQSTSLATPFSAHALAEELRFYAGEVNVLSRGEQEACVKACGLAFVGRAHSGLVDSRNTAAICCQMLLQGFRFTRPTRGFAPDGNVWGQKKKQKVAQASP
jgi:inhibitor of KinA sporulation pathway (predicted exonuclease)